MASTATATTADNDWKYVGRKGVTMTHPPVAKWGQSALKKPAPKPKTFEQEFPSLGSKTIKPFAAQPHQPLSMADRMKQKLAEEAAEAERKAEEAKKKAAADNLTVHSLNFGMRFASRYVCDDHDEHMEDYGDDDDEKEVFAYPEGAPEYPEDAEDTENNEDEDF